MAHRHYGREGLTRPPGDLSRNATTGRPCVQAAAPTEGGASVGKASGIVEATEGLYRALLTAAVEWVGAQDGAGGRRDRRLA